MDSNVTYEVNNGLAAGVMIVIWLFALALAVLAIIGLWKTFRKAGLPGWAAIIPFYNEYNVVKMSNRPIWFFWAMLGCSLLAWIPFLGWLLIIGLIVLWVFVALDIAANFGQGTGFAILLIIFPSIMFLILGFGSAQFNRVAAPGSAGFGAPPMPAGAGYAAAPPQPPAAGTYVAPPAPPAPPAAPVTPAATPAAPVTPVTPAEAAAAPVTPTAPVTPPVTPAEAPAAETAVTEAPAAAPEAAQEAATEVADAAVPDAPAAPDVPPTPPASSPPPPPPLT
jgi:hypothetical protein